MEIHSEMSETEGSLENLWGQLLSRQADLVRQAYDLLSPAERQAVLSHLQRMANEPGWHEEQRISAQAALNALRKKDI
jgi:hypothetical protein